MLRVELVDQGPLTKCEARVLQALCTGERKKRIAARLHRSARTIDSHVESIKRKLEARSCTEAILKAITKKMVSIDEEDAAR